MTRLIVFTSAFAIAATAVMAGDSVIHIKSRKIEAGSVISYDCADCPELKPDFESPDVHGVEVNEHQVDGKKKIVQVDNMMGGSAVRIVKAGATPSADSGDAGETKSWKKPFVAGETVVHEDGGTLVTTNDDGPKPFVADSGVTFEGGGEFNVDEVAEDQPVQDGVDGGSQTSSVESVNMNDAEHDNAGPGEPAQEEPHNPGPEIIELRPSN